MMIKKRLLASLTFSLIILFTTPINAQSNHEIVIAADKPIAEVQPTMWGIFFEDINFGADGGIYAELIKNRSFEFSMPLMRWTVQKLF